MRFGVIMPIQLKDTGLDDHFEELREEVAVAEEAGFDAVFLPEFHQARGGALVSPLLVGAALLQGTSRIRFGSAVLATPLHHPVRLAEDAIMLDWITRGRVILGLGIAHQVPDFNAFGVPRDERIEVFEEVLDLLDLCFAGEPYTYEGKHFTSEAHITPRPYTLPRPEIWVGAHSQSGLERAARRGDLWLADPQRDVQTIAKLAVTYRRHAEELGKTPRIGIFREAWIGDSKEECERVWAANPMQVHRLYYNVGTYKKRFEPWVDDAVDRENFTLDKLAPGRFLYGSPEEIRAEVEEWRELTGCEYLALRFRHPGGPTHARDDGGAAPLRRRGDHPPGSTDDHDGSPTMTVSTTTDQLFSPFEHRRAAPAESDRDAGDGNGPARARRHLQRRDDRVLPAPRRGRSRDDHDRGEPRLPRRLRGRPRAAAPRRGVHPRACGGWSRRCGPTRSRSGSSSGTRAGRPCSASRSRRRRCRSPPGRRSRTS